MGGRRDGLRVLGPRIRSAVVCGQRREGLFDTGLQTVEQNGNCRWFPISPARAGQKVKAC